MTPAHPSRAVKHLRIEDLEVDRLRVRELIQGEQRPPHRSSR